MGVTLSHSLPIDCGSDCGPGGVKSEATIQVPEINPAISVEFKFKAFNGKGEADGIFCVEGTLEIE
jgi:hypothetical protein